MAASFGFSPDRLQLTSLSYAKGAQTLFSLNYWYKQDATNCATGTAGNNGQVQCITDNVDAGRSVKYTYDPLVRLATAVTTGSASYPQWGLSWTYDRYGNRTAQSISAGCVAPQTCPTNSLSFANPGGAQTNRPDNYAHDANGNMTNDGLNTLTYDGENRLVTSSGSSYSYDGNSLRVKKVSAGTTTAYIFSGSKVIAEYENGAAPASPTREYIYSGGALLAKIEGGATKYYHADHLSVRASTDTSGNVLGRQGHYPFGESWYGSSATTKWQFTSYERDAESGNDYAMARYHVNRLGRFSSPDPMAGFIGAPQSLNRYTYVRGDPTNLVDPSGLCVPTFSGPPDDLTFEGWICIDDSHYHAPELPGTEGGGGGGGDPGGGRQEQEEKEVTKTLPDCVDELFGVSLRSFTPSRPGSSGAFVGYGPDSRRNRGNNATITVVNDVRTLSSSFMGWLTGSPTDGMTFGINPYRNFTANDVRNPSQILRIQVHELGHSLTYVTGAADKGPRDAGYRLEDCVFSR